MAVAGCEGGGASGSLNPDKEPAPVLTEIGGVTTAVAACETGIGFAMLILEGVLVPTLLGMAVGTRFG